MPLYLVTKHGGRGFLRVHACCRACLLKASIRLAVDRERGRNALESRDVGALILDESEIELLRIKAASIEPVASEDPVVPGGAVLGRVHVERAERRPAASLEVAGEGGA